MSWADEPSLRHGDCRPPSTMDGRSTTGGGEPRADGRTGEDHRESGYESASLTLAGAVAMGTGVMIGAGIFALTGQVAELAGDAFPLAFVGAALVTAFSAYSYAKVASRYPSAGGIARILERAYGKGVITGASALLMYMSMVINESLVARTFAAYAIRVVGDVDTVAMMPLLGTALLVVAFVVNLLGTAVIGGLSKAMALVKILGVSVFALVALWVAGGAAEAVASTRLPSATEGFLAGVCLAVLAYKGFTTITNSGAEIANPKRNLGRAIWVSLGLCAVLYLLVSLAVAANLSVEQVVAARDSALAEAARPALGVWGERLTVLLAIVATVSGLVASLFAVSRLLAMLSESGFVPSSPTGLPGRTQVHALVFTTALAIGLTLAFDLGRIASLGAIVYLVMDMVVHAGTLRELRRAVSARPAILIAALILDALVLGALLSVKLDRDPLVVWLAGGSMILVVADEWAFLRRSREMA